MTGVLGLTGFQGVTGIGASSTASGVALIKYYSQTNSFITGDVVRLDSTGNLVLAQANTPANAEAIGIIQSANGTDCTVVLEGYITGLNSLIQNSIYFLSADQTGKLTATDPNVATATLVSKPMLDTDTTSSGYVLTIRGMYSDPSAIGTYPYITVQSDYSIKTTDYSIFADSSHNPRNMYLPDASLIPGKEFNIKKIDSLTYPISIIGYNGQLIDGDSTQIISSPYSSMTIQSNGYNWWII